MIIFSLIFFFAGIMKGSVGRRSAELMESVAQ